MSLAAWTEGAKKYTPTGARSVGGCFGFSTSRTRPPMSFNSAMPNRLGLSTVLRSTRGRPGLLPERPAKQVDVAADQIIPQIHNKRRILPNAPGGLHRVGQPRGLLLEDVRDAHPEPAAVAHRLLDQLPGLRADDDSQVADPGPGQVFNHVKQVGLVGHRDHCLAAVWVKGRNRVPLPPLRIKPFKFGSSHPNVPGFMKKA